ncbi:hypothetical protein V6N13_074007 [Hibiscus sabdariffa]
MRIQDKQSGPTRNTTHKAHPVVIAASLPIVQGASRVCTDKQCTNQLQVSSTSVGLRSNEPESVGDSILSSSSQEADCTQQEDVHTINESLPQLSGCGLDIQEMSQGVENSGVGMSSMMGSGTQNE